MNGSKKASGRAIVALLAATVTTAASLGATRGQPVIELDGPNPMKLPVSQESYSDPGAGCYDALRKEDIGETLDVSGDIVRLDIPNTYTIRYGCTTKDGEEATPVFRHIIVSPEVTPEYWTIQASADISLPSFTAVTAEMKNKVAQSLSEDLDVPEEDISIDAVSEQQMWDKSAYLTVKFKIKTTQRALTEDLEYELRDKSFGADFAATMKQAGMQAQHVTLGPKAVKISPPGPTVEAELTLPDVLVAGAGVLGLGGAVFFFYRKYTAAKAELIEYQLASTSEETSGFADKEATSASASASAAAGAGEEGAGGVV